MTSNAESALKLRTIEMGDAEAVARLAGELGYERSPEEVSAWIAELGRFSDRQTAFVALLADEVVGWIEVSLERRLQSAESALIGGLVVSEGVRGSNIGRKLCQQAEAWSWERGVTTLRVTSRSTRTDAHRFYERDGYEQVKTSVVFEKKRQ